MGARGVVRNLPTAWAPSYYSKRLSKIGKKNFFARDSICQITLTDNKKMLKIDIFVKCNKNHLEIFAKKTKKSDRKVEKFDIY